VLAGPWAGTAPLAVALPLVLLLWSVLWAGAFLAGMDCRRSTGWPVVGLLLVSATVTAAVAWDRLAQRWPQRSSGERVLAMVTVDSLPATQGGALGFEAEVQVVAPRSLQRSLRLQVTWRDAPRPMPRVGERWWLVLRVDALPVVRNPGGFDVSRAALRSDIDGRATVVTVSSNRRIYAAGRGLDPLRERIEGAIRDTVEDRDAAALFAGLAVGATGTMTREQWQVFAATGTTHLVAISGMHVTLFAWLAAGAARRLWSLGAARARRRAPPIGREPFAAVIGTTAALGYALLAGFGIPTQRTVVMLAVWWLMRLGGRERSGFEVLGWALLAVLALDPLAPLSSGFWLSFGAMAVLLAGDLEKGGVTPGAVRALLVTQWRVGIALAPLTLAWFGSVSLAVRSVGRCCRPRRTGRGRCWTWIRIPGRSSCSLVCCRSGCCRCRCVGGWPVSVRCCLGRCRPPVGCRGRTCRRKVRRRSSCSMPVMASRCWCAPVTTRCWWTRRLRRPHAPLRRSPRWWLGCAQAASEGSTCWC